MENSIFKDFNYVIIDSSISKHKEVMVTYSYMNRPVRQYLFIKEVNRKNNDYYINEAKKIISQKIENGELVKSSNKLVKKVKHAKHARTGAKKPLLIATSCVLAAGALGTGGYFLGSYLGGGGRFDTSGHTVVLQAGEGSFANQKTFLIFNNVKDGTALGDIDGYALPSGNNDLDFDQWTGALPDGYGTGYKIVEDLVLTATYTEGLGFVRTKQRNLMLETLNNAKELEISDEAKATLQKVYDEGVAAIYDKSITLEKDGKSTVVDLATFAIETMNIICKHPDTHQAVYDYYSPDIEDLLAQENSALRFALARLYSEYIRACQEAKDKQLTYLDQAFNTMKSNLMNYKENYPTDELLRLAGYMGAGLEASTVNFLADDSAMYGKMLDKVNIIIEKVRDNVFKAGDTESVDWLGDFCYSSFRVIGHFYGFADDKNYFESFMHSLETEESRGPIQIIINSIKTGAKDFNRSTVEIQLMSLKAFSELDLDKGIPSYDATLGQEGYISNCMKKYRDLSEILTGKSEIIAAVLQAFQSALDVFAITPNARDVDLIFYRADPEGGKDLGFISVILSMMSPASVTSREALVLNQIKCVKNVIQIAKEIALDKESPTSYTDLMTNFDAVFGSTPPQAKINTSAYECCYESIVKIMEVMTWSDYLYEKEDDLRALQTIFRLFMTSTLPTAQVTFDSELSNMYVDLFANLFNGAHKFWQEYSEEGFTDGIVQLYVSSLAKVMLDTSSISIFDAGFAKALKENYLPANRHATLATIDLFMKVTSQYVNGIYDVVSGSRYPDDAFSTVSQLVSLLTGFCVQPIGNEMVSQPDDVFDAYYSLLDEIFATMMKLKRTTEEGQALLLQYVGIIYNKEKLDNSFAHFFIDYFEESKELKVAIHDEFTSKIDESTTMAELQEYGASAMKACKEVVGE